MAAVYQVTLDMHKIGQQLGSSILPEPGISFSADLPVPVKDPEEHHTGHIVCRLEEILLQELNHLRIAGTQGADSLGQHLTFRKEALR